MKKLITFILFMASTIAFASAGNIATNNLSSMYNSCNPSESLNVYYYLDNGNSITRKPYDIFLNTIDSIISLESVVDIWRNGNILTNCTDWNRVSNVTVANDPNWSLAIQNYDGCVFNKPNYLKHSDPNKIDAQIHVHLKYFKIFGWASNSITSRFFHRDLGSSTWTCYPGGNAVTDYSSCPSQTVKYWIINSHTWECLNYRLFWCWDGLVNRPGWYTSYSNWNFSEECDPNDPNKVGWWNGWCSNSCKAITQNVPTCSLSISPLQNSTYRVNWTVNWTFNPTQITIQPTLFSPSYKNVNINVWSFDTVAPHWYYGPFTATMTVTNSAGSNTCRATYNIPQQTKTCWDWKVDRPNDNGVYEQCDNGPNFGNWCNNRCQLMTPSCDLMITPPVWVLGKPTVFHTFTDSWAISNSLDLWNHLAWGFQNIVKPLSWYVEYIYPHMADYTVVFGAKNNYTGEVATWVEMPITYCTGEVTILPGCDIEIPRHPIELWEVAEIKWRIWPAFNIPASMQVSHPIVNPPFVGPWPHNIYSKTWSVFVWPNITHTWDYTFSISSHTIYGQEFSCTGVLRVWKQTPQLKITKTLLNTWSFSSGDYVGFKIELTNTGSWVYHNAYIKDLLPSSLNLVSHNIQWVYPYQSGLYMSGALQVLEYSWFNLNVWQTAVMYLTWQVRGDASPNNTINWAFTSWAYDTAWFALRPKAFIQKYQRFGDSPFTTGDISINTWNLITYRIDFANAWVGTATGVRVVDHMPLCITYLSASINGVTWANFYQSWDWTGRYIVEYSWFDLAPGQTWYMIITGRLVDSPICNAYTSFVNDSYIYFYTPTEVFESSTTGYRYQRSIVVLTKDSEPDQHLLWEGKLFEVKVANQWPNSISNIVLQDIWPNPSCISYVDWTGDAGLTKNPVDLAWSYSGLNPWEDLTLYISGQVSNNTGCVSSDYVNTMRLAYKELGINYTGEDSYHFSVVWTENALCDYITTGGNLTVDEHNHWSRNFICYSQNGVIADEIVIDCGNWIVRTGYNRSEFTHTCPYVYNPSVWVTGNTYNVQCYVDEHTRDQCSTSVRLDSRLVGVCGNGVIDEWEECDLWTNTGLITQWVRIWNYLDINRDYLAWIYGNWNHYCQECRIREYQTNEFVHQPPQCLWTNTTISLMNNELMPFWWRLWKRTNQFVKSNYNCSAIDTNETVTYIDENSMQCTFAVYDGNRHQQINDNPLHTFVTDCYEKDNSVMFKYFEKAYKIDFDKVAWRYVFNTKSMFNGNVDTYWEYKLVLEKVDFRYCDPSSKSWEQWRTYKGICEVNFALTRPYIMQISTFGVNPVASNASDFLTDFYDMKWNPLIKSTDIQDTISVNSATYGFDSDVVNQMNNFKDKYESLSVAVDKNFKVRDNVRIRDIFGDNSIVKKVPNQMIFFVKWSGELVLRQMTKHFPSDPFTIYIEWMDVLVEWSITTNWMIITTETISFEDDREHAYCEEGWQVVNGIFIARWGFDSENRTRNENKNTERCPWGNLHVKWVLIGHGVENLVNNRRSHLNDWFEVKSNLEASIKRERRNEIFEWAALLIEYNPSLWTQLPPWADSFTETLDVYRK